MAITEADKVRARHHMGYLQVQEASTFVLGVPAGVQTQFVIEGALNKILPQAEDRFSTLLDNLDATEQQILDDQENLAVDQIAEIKVRADEFEQLVKRYQYWQGTLGNLLGVPPNPFDQRFSSWGGSKGVNIPVMHG
jgi:hypothetical protein